MPVGSPGLADVVAHAARLAGGQTFTGSGQAVRAVPRRAGAVRLRRRRAVRRGGRSRSCTAPSRWSPIASRASCRCAKLLLRLSLVRAERRDAGALVSRRTALRDGAPRAGAAPGRVPAPRGGGRHRRAAGCARRPRCARARRPARSRPRNRSGCSASSGSPPRMHGLLTRTPGLDVFVPVTDNVARRRRLPPPDPSRIVPRQLSRPIACTCSRPGGVTEVSPLPVLAAIEDVVRVRAPEARVATVAPRAPPELSLALRARGGRAVVGTDGGGADPLEPACVVAAPLLRAAGVRAAPLPGRVARARRAGARERRARGDPVRDAVRAGRARRAGAGGDAARPRGVAGAAGRAAGRDRAAHRRVSRSDEPAVSRPRRRAGAARAARGRGR